MWKTYIDLVSLYCYKLSNQFEMRMWGGGKKI